MNNSVFDLRQLPDELVFKINTYLVNQRGVKNYILTPPVRCDNLAPNRVLTITEVITRPDNQLELIPDYSDVDRMLVKNLKEELKQRGNYIRPGINKKSLIVLLKRNRGTLILPIGDILNRCPNVISNINIRTKQTAHDWM